MQCHVCGRFYGGLPRHIVVHGLTADEYKEQFGLARTTALWSPQCLARQRQAALAHNLGAIGRANLAELPHPGRARGLDTRLSSRLTQSATKRGTYRGRQHISEAAPTVAPPTPRPIVCARCGQTFDLPARVRWAKYCPSCRPVAYGAGKPR